jgi:hypothetical protein
VLLLPATMCSVYAYSVTLRRSIRNAYLCEYVQDAPAQLGTKIIPKVGPISNYNVSAYRHNEF